MANIYLFIVYKRPFCTKLAFPVEFSLKKFSEYTVYFSGQYFFCLQKYVNCNEKPQKKDHFEFIMSIMVNEIASCFFQNIYD